MANLDAYLVDTERIQNAISASGDIVAFESAVEAPIESLKFYINHIQAGEGIPSPTNIRQISGWRRSFLTISGRNMLRITGNSGTGTGIHYEFNADGSVTANGTSGGNSFRNLNYMSNRTLIPKNTPLKSAIKADKVSSLAIRAYLNSEDNVTILANSLEWKHSRVYNADGRQNYLRMNVSTDGTVIDDVTAFPMVILGDETAGEFEKFKGTAVEIDWDEAAGLIADGQFDAKTGVFKITHSYALDYSGVQWEKIDAEGSVFRRVPSKEDGVGGKALGVTNVISNKYATRSGDENLSIFGSSSSPEIYIRDDAYSTAEEFAAAQNDLQILWELETPIERQLDPVSMTTLRGANRIWAEAGPVEVNIAAVDGRLRFKLIDA